MYSYDYLIYNREERDLCAHLFRLLLDDQKEWKPLKKFLGKDEVENPRIFCEVSIILHGYVARNGEIHDYMHGLCELIAEMNEIKDYTKFAEIPLEFHKASKNIYSKRKIDKAIEECTGDELQNILNYNQEPNTSIYKTLQSMFNAKPDLAVCEGNNLYVFEAKYDSSFEPKQLKLTNQIAQVWSKLLYRDLGFEEVPNVFVLKLGRQKFKPDVSWEYVYEISKEFLGEDDFSTMVLSKVIK